MTPLCLQKIREKIIKKQPPVDIGKIHRLCRLRDGATVRKPICMEIARRRLSILRPRDCRQTGSASSNAHHTGKSLVTSIYPVVSDSSAEPNCKRDSLCIPKYSTEAKDVLFCFFFATWKKYTVISFMPLYTWQLSLRHSCIRKIRYVLRFNRLQR